MREIRSMHMELHINGCVVEAYLMTLSQLRRGLNVEWEDTSELWIGEAFM
jgi:hypothetical protein